MDKEEIIRRLEALGYTGGGEIYSFPFELDVDDVVDAVNSKLGRLLKNGVDGHATTTAGRTLLHFKKPLSDTEKADAEAALRDIAFKLKPESLEEYY